MGTIYFMYHNFIQYSKSELLKLSNYNLTINKKYPSFIF